GPTSAWRVASSAKGVAPNSLPHKRVRSGGSQILRCLSASDDSTVTGKWTFASVGLLVPLRQFPVRLLPLLFEKFPLVAGAGGQAAFEHLDRPCRVPGFQ